MIESDLKMSHFSEDRFAYAKMKNCVEWKSGHFYLSLLWRNSNPQIPDNRKMAEQRLLSLKRRLANNSQLQKRYVEEMKKYIDEEYAEMVPDDQIIKTKSVTSYLPHHPVFNPKKPEKLRIVFHCATEYRGM